jgi:hypothetical protein
MTGPKVVTLSGEPIEHAIEGNTPLATLKRLVEKVESGDIVLKTVLILGESPSPKDPSCVFTKAWDSDITVERMITIMEMTKFDLIAKSMGIIREDDA